MANWQQPTQQATDNQDNKYRDIANMIVLAKADPQTQLGYVLGKYLGNYVQRGLDNIQRNKADSSTISNTAPETDAPQTQTQQNIDSKIADYISANQQNSSASDSSSIGVQGRTGNALTDAMNGYSTNFIGGLFNTANQANASDQQTDSQPATANTQQIDQSQLMPTDRAQAAQLVQADIQNAKAERDQAMQQTGAQAQPTTAINLLGNSLGGQNNQPTSALDKYINAQGIDASGMAQQMAANAQNTPGQSPGQIALQTQQDNLMAQNQNALQQYQIGQQQKINNIVKLASMFGGSFDVAAPADSNTKITGDGSGEAANQSINTQQPEQLDYVGRNLATKLVAAKQGYMAAQDAYDNAKTDDDKAKAQDAMSRYSTAADAIRQSAQAAGINLSQYGADTNLETAAQNLQNDFYTGIRKILNSDMTSDEYYNQIFNQVKSNGGTDRQAKMIAGEKAAVYQSQRMARLSTAFENYGLDQMGSMNNVGAQILMQMQQENPAQANGFAALYASPKDDYAFNRQVDLQNNQSTNQLRNETTLNNQKHALHENEEDTNLVRKEKLISYNSSVNVKEKAQLAKIAVAVKGLEIQQQIDILYSAGIKMGMSPEDARAMALGMTGGRGGSNGRVDKADSQFANQLEYLFGNAKARGSDGQISADSVDALKDFVNKNVGKYDTSTNDYMNSMVLAAEGLREKAAGHEDMAAQYFSGIPPYLQHKLLPEYYGTGD